MNKTRKLAEDLVNKHSALFTTEFSSNKEAVDRVLVIRNRALRNQIAGAITVIMKERLPKLANAEPSSMEFPEAVQQGEAELHQPQQQQQGREQSELTGADEGESQSKETLASETSPAEPSHAGGQIEQEQQSPA